MKYRMAALALGAIVGLAASCGDDVKDDNGGGGGSGGAAGSTAGSGGRGGSGGTGGRAGGSAGSSAGGSGGAAGSSAGGSGGAAGSSAGGSGGTAGSGGSGGAGGRAGSGGSAGSGGAGGSAGSGGAGGRADAGADAPSSDARMALSFFITSKKNTTGNLGGLAGADKTCQDLATAVGAGNRMWKAYLSADMPRTNARDRIGNGPWYNAKGMLVAQNLAQLHMRSGDPDIFLDEAGMKVPGNYPGSMGSNEHDILTGTNADGSLREGHTCKGWTSALAADKRSVGHHDGRGPGMTQDSPYNRWNDAHPTQSQTCDNTQPGGGAGRFYCFAAD